MKIDWKSKLTSRKFWSAVAGFIVPLLLAFGVSDSNITQVTALIMSGGSLIAYIFGEGMIDVGRNTDRTDTNAIGFSSDDEDED